MWDFSDIWLLTQQIRMCLLCKIRQNIWSAFLKSLPLHHITPEWWNGRHEGLKIPWPLRLYEFESRFRHLPSVGFPAGGIFCALTFALCKSLCASLWGRTFLCNCRLFQQGCLLFGEITFRACFSIAV